MILSLRRSALMSSEICSSASVFLRVAFAFSSVAAAAAAAKASTRERGSRTAGRSVRLRLTLALCLRVRLHGYPCELVLGRESGGGVGGVCMRIMTQRAIIVHRGRRSERSAAQARRWRPP